jgi:ABC-type multidrug transport system fused ATPase/permease subunit
MPVETLPLRDIHLPEPVSWWPPAPGWWLLLILIATVIAAVLLFRLFRRRRRLKRTIRAELDMLRRQYRENHDQAQLLKSLSALMRRASISFYPRNQSASLTGKEWLQHLDRTALRKEFQHGIGSILAAAPYQPASSKIDTDFDDLLSLCDDWLKLQPVKGERP